MSRAPTEPSLEDVSYDDAASPARRVGRRLRGTKMGARSLTHREIPIMNSHATEVAFFASAAWIAWAAAYAWSRWLVRPHREADVDARARDYELEQRLASIERTMQAIAIEVERLGEGQRFT